MKVYTRVQAEWKDGRYVITDSTSFEYSGDAALCDRGAQAAAQNLQRTDAGVAATKGAESATELGALTPFASRWMQATHTYDPNQINEMLTAAEAPAGAALGAQEGEATRQAASTRNASGFAKTLDELARLKDKTLAGTSEGIASQDVQGALEKQKEGANLMQGLYGTNTSAQLNAMGQQNQAIGTAIEAGKSGWLQNMTSVLDSLGKLGSGVGAAATGIKS